MLVNRDKSFIFYPQSPTSSCKSSIQMFFFVFCLFCGFSKHSGCVYIDLSPITGAIKVCRTMELLAEENSCRKSEKYIVIIITTIAPNISNKRM